YCQQFGIGSPVASFLVLESDVDYKRFNLEEERGRTVAGDLAAYLDEAWKQLGRAASPREAFARFLARLGPRVQLPGDEWANVPRLLALLSDAELEASAAA